MKTTLRSKEGIFDLAGEECTRERWMAMELVALVEIRETIEEGFARLNQTNIETATMLGGVKQSFDTFLADRLGSSKVMDALTNEIEATPEKKVDQPKKSAVTLNVGDFGGPVSDSGIS